MFYEMWSVRLGPKAQVSLRSSDGSFRVDQTGEPCNCALVVMSEGPRQKPALYFIEAGGHLNGAPLAKGQWYKFRLATVNDIGNPVTIEMVQASRAEGTALRDFPDGEEADLGYDILK